MLVSGGIAVYVHSLFPKKHDRHEDFGKLLKDGPYRFVRHPFYSAFLFLGFGIALFFASVPGIAVSLLMVPSGKGSPRWRRGNFWNTGAGNTGSSWKPEAGSCQELIRARAGFFSFSRFSSSAILLSTVSRRFSLIATRLSSSSALPFSRS